MAELFQLAPQGHTEKLLPMIDQILADSGLSLSRLDAIAFTRGPGSFTGLRICFSTMQGLALGADIPVVPISSLAALAQTAADEQLLAGTQQVLSTLDARMGELYWATFQCINGQPVTTQCIEHVSKPEAVRIDNPDGDRTIIGIGSGFCYAQQIACQTQLQCVIKTLLPRASAAARLGKKLFVQGQYFRADQVKPIYLRNDVSWKK